MLLFRIQGLEMLVNTKVTIHKYNFFLLQTTAESTDASTSEV